MKAYTKSLNTRATAVSAKAVAKLVVGALFFFAWLGIGLADQMVRSVLPFRLPFTGPMAGIFLFFFLWLCVGGFLDFRTLNRAKELEDELRDGPLSIARLLEDRGRRAESRLLRGIAEMKRRKLFRSVAVLEDCLVFERASDARPLLLMAERGMRFSMGHRRYASTELFLVPILTGLFYGLSVDTAAWPGFFAPVSAMLISFGVLALFAALRKPSHTILYRKERTLEVVAEAAEQPKSGDSAADALIGAAAEHIRELELLDHAIQDEYVSERIREISTATRQLIEFLRGNPHRQSQAKQLIDYALPTTIKLLKQYDYLNSQPVKGENINKSMAKIVEMSGAVSQTMKRELDALYAEGSIDIEADIEVMKTMLGQEQIEIKHPEF